MTITLRNTKGSALTYNELDANFIDLNTRTQTGWIDLPQVVQVFSGTNAPTFAQFRDGIWAYQFAESTMNECWVNFHLNHEYIAETMIYPHIHWCTNLTNTGTVRWGYEYTIAQRSDGVPTGAVDFGATTTTYLEKTLSSNSQYKHILTEPPDGTGISGTGMSVDTLILCRVFRDATHINDTFPGPVFMLAADVHHEVNVLATPNRIAPFS